MDPLVTPSGGSNPALMAALLGGQQQPSASTNVTSLQQAVNSLQQAGSEGTSLALQSPAEQPPLETLQTTQTSNAMAVDPKEKKTPDPNDRFARKIEAAKVDNKKEKVDAKVKTKERAVALRRHNKLMERRKFGPRKELPQQKVPPGHFSFPPAASPTPTSPPGMPPTPTSPPGMTFNEHLTVLEKSGREAARAADEADKELEATAPTPAPAAATNASGALSPSQQQLESDIHLLEQELEQDVNEFNQFGDGNMVD